MENVKSEKTENVNERTGLIFAIAEDKLKTVVQDAVRTALECYNTNLRLTEKEVESPTYYSRKDICSIAHISTTTLWRLEVIGVISSVKVGRHNLYNKVEIDNLISAGKLSKYNQ